MVSPCDRESGACRGIKNDVWQRRDNDKDDTPKKDLDGVS